MSTDAPTTPPPSADSQKRPWWKRWWGIAAIVIVIIGTFANLGDDEQPDAEETEPAAAESEDSQPGAADDETSQEPTDNSSEEPAASASDDTPAEVAPEPEPEAELEASPEPEPEPVGIGNGTFTIGDEVEPGTYRSDGTSMCYWARLAGFSGELDDIIVNGNNATIVTISEGDVGFETTGCGMWVPVEETYPSAPESTFGDGTFAVGQHIEPGRYKADGSADTMCYWARLSDFGHELGGIITNGNSPTTIEIAASDAGFEATGCGTWTLQ